MEQTEVGKEWFVTHEGKQFGPVSLDDLRFEMERGELDPRLDMVWKNGMADWIAAGEVEGLFKRNDLAAADEGAKSTAKAFNEYIPGETEEERSRIKGDWPGVGRGTFFFFTCLFPFLWMAGVIFGMTFLEGKIDPGILALIPIALALVPLILGIAVMLKRLQNLGMSRAWFLGILVPLLGLWVNYRTFACPPGYAVNKRLDALGWFLAILYWLLTLSVIAAIAASIHLTMDDPDRLRQWIPEEDFRKFSEMMEKLPPSPEPGK